MHVFTVESQKSYDLRNVWSFNKYITGILFLNCFTHIFFSIDFISNLHRNIVQKLNVLRLVS